MCALWSNFDNSSQLVTYLLNVNFFPLENVSVHLGLQVIHITMSVSVRVAWFVFWSQSLVPVASVSLILSPSLLVLFIYYVEAIQQFSMYLHVTLELDPEIQLIFQYSHCNREFRIPLLSLTAVPLVIWQSFFLWVFPTRWQYNNAYRNTGCRKAWRLAPQLWWKCIIYGNCLLKLPRALFKLTTSV